MFLIRMDELFGLQTLPFYMAGVAPMCTERTGKEKGNNFQAILPICRRDSGCRGKYLGSDRSEDKHIFLITNGEPTACIKDGMVHLQCPPTSTVFDRRF